MLLASAAAEVLLRLAPGILPEEAQLRLHWDELRTMRTVAIGDSYLGFTYPPLHEGRIDRGETDFSYTTDEHGFRNPAPWPDTAGVVIVGDSQAFGYGVEDQQTWARLLAADLTAPVVNLALPGAAPRQYTRFLERYGIGLSPRLVLYCLFPGNDVYDERLFHSWLEAGSPGNYDVWRFFRGRVPGEGNWLAKLGQKSYLLTMARAGRSGITSRFAGQTLDVEDGGRLRLAPTAYDAAVKRTRPGNASFERAIESVLMADSLAREAGSALLVVLVPTKEEVYLPILGEPTPQLVAPFASELTELGIEILDLTPAFRETAERGVTLFFDIDGHPNVAGNRLWSDVVRVHIYQNAHRYRLDGGH